MEHETDITNEQIHARCQEAVKSVTFLCLQKIVPSGYIENMYREALAKGLELAVRIMWDESEGDLDLARLAKLRNKAKEIRRGE